jgi:hypothetical protein
MASQTLDSFCHWLAATSASQTIQTIDWLIPVVQTVHILAVAAVVTSALMVDLRLLGVRQSDQSVAGIVGRFLPLIWWALPVLLATGAVLIVAEPARALENPVFLLKMVLLLVAASVTLACQLPIQRNVAFWELTPGRRRAGKIIALASIPLWIAIVCAGRWIAYVQVS